MKPRKQYPDFLHIGHQIIRWYEDNGRKFPFRDGRTPYLVWIAEVIFQQTRIQQGMAHYLRFVERFPTVQHLASATEDEIMLYWKGLGYYSRAINLHKAARKIVNDFSGEVPRDYHSLLALQGIGKYIASAIMSIAYNAPYPAIDGNLYRVLSRFFSDGYDIAHPRAFEYFSNLAMRMMPPERPGDFNEALMDIGAQICTPKSPSCYQCPLQYECSSYTSGNPLDLPVKTKKNNIKKQTLNYFFLHDGQSFLVRQRDKSSYWKSLYEFPSLLPTACTLAVVKTHIIPHRFTHKELEIRIDCVEEVSSDVLMKIKKIESLDCISFSQMEAYAFPQPLYSFLKLFLK